MKAFLKILNLFVSLAHMIHDHVCKGKRLGEADKQATPKENHSNKEDK